MLHVNLAKRMCRLELTFVLKNILAHALIVKTLLLCFLFFIDSGYQV